MWTVIDHLISPLIGAWLGNRFARHREREKAAQRRLQSILDDADPLELISRL